MSAQSLHLKGLSKLQPRALERDLNSVEQPDSTKEPRAFFCRCEQKPKHLRHLVKEPILELGKAKLAGPLARVGDGTCIFRRPRLPGVAGGPQGSLCLF